MCGVVLVLCGVVCLCCVVLVVVCCVVLVVRMIETRGSLSCHAPKCT